VQRLGKMDDSSLDAHVLMMMAPTLPKLWLTAGGGGGRGRQDKWVVSPAKDPHN
jgi:hypothetical protein